MDIAWIWRQTAVYWPRALLVVLLGFLTVSSHIGLMATAAYLLACAALQPPILDLMVTIVGVRFFGISRAVLRYLERLFAHDLTFRILSKLRVGIYQGIEPMIPAGLQNYRHADLLGRIVGDVETLQNLFLKVLAPPLVAVLVLLGYAVFLAAFDDQLPYLLAAFFLLAGLVLPFSVMRLSRGVGRTRVEKKALLQVLVLDILKGMPEILTFGQVKNSLLKLSQIQAELRKAETKHAKIMGYGSAFSSLLINLSMWSFLLLGIMLVENGELDPLYLGMLVLGTLSSFEAVLPLNSSFQLVEENRVAAERLNAILQNGHQHESAVSSKPVQAGKTCEENKTKKVEKETSFPILDRSYPIQFSEVSFCYNHEEEPALKNISFTIPAGGKAAIVGPSGAGKTSIINLLLKFWEPDAGRIAIGNNCTMSCAAEDVRRLMGVVMQRTHLFNATLKENLLLANPEATDQQIMDAARRAKLHDFILSLPDGYDSYIGEGGMKISGGQQQRLAIARVLLKNAPILILDEATSGLDPATEQQVIQEIMDVCREKTVVLVTHHMEIARDMPQIFVVDHGEIVERGNHEELLYLKGVYYDLWTSRQFRQDSSDE